MFTTDVLTYEINLALPESQRWGAVIDRDRVAAGRLVAEAGDMFRLVPEVARWVLAWFYKRSGGLYRGELDAWADALGVSVGTVTLLNCAYELSHVRWPKVFGCTAGVRWLDQQGMVHVRCLDWPLATMAAATRLFRFRRGPRTFVAVGVPGQVGILSGMVPGAYSVTINWAPPVAQPCFEFGPTFLLRDILETCDSYDAAVRRLTETPLSTSVFFTVCGTERGQACVIERTQREAAVRPLIGPVLVQTNHHVAGRFAGNNADILIGEGDDDVFTLTGSTKRAETLGMALAELPATCDPDTAAATLSRLPVLNRDTCQQMVFRPARGTVTVWRRAEG